MVTNLPGLTLRLSNVWRPPSFESGQDRGSYVTVFVKQRPVYAVPDFMVSFSNILPSSESQGPGHSCHITKVWPEKYWDEETATLRTMPSPSNRIIGLFRFFCSHNCCYRGFCRWFEKKPRGSLGCMAPAATVNGRTPSSDSGVSKRILGFCKSESTTTA